MIPRNPPPPSFPQTKIKWKIEIQLLLAWNNYAWKAQQLPCTGTRNKQGIKQQRSRICKFKNMFCFFAKRALWRPWPHVTHLFRFYNTFRIYSSMQCLSQICISREERWVRDCHLLDCLTCLVTKVIRRANSLPWKEKELSFVSQTTWGNDRWYLLSVNWKEEV